MNRLKDGKSAGWRRRLDYVSCVRERIKVWRGRGKVTTLLNASRCHAKPFGMTSRANCFGVTSGWRCGNWLAQLIAPPVLAWLVTPPVLARLVPRQPVQPRFYATMSLGCAKVFGVTQLNIAPIGTKIGRTENKIFMESFLKYDF
jgi:hypothetical protein